MLAHMSWNAQRTSPIPFFRNGRCRSKRVDAEEPVSKIPRLSDSANDTGYLSTSPASPVSAASPGTPASHQGLSRICQFLLLPVSDREGVHSALHINTGEEFVCKVFSLKHYQEKIRPHTIVPAHKNISQIKDIVLGDQKAYVFFEKDFGDMHTFVKGCKKLNETQASGLFRQIVSAVSHCHQSGVVLGDLKLRKFVFADEKRTHLKLESLEETHVLEGEDDSVSHKHGCPAYVSPEILNATSTYSGKQADVWSLGVMLYTLLVGRYPFHDADPSALFSKIRRGQYCIPESVSPKAKCLIRSLLRREPGERLTAAEILIHPWFQSFQDLESPGQESEAGDQTVPTFHLDEDETMALFC
ncbi:tribbles homolog 1 [Lepisosteus oculatus]|uniref:tribbles homolog 1 n=1 Tax=Lepisosteus oculatus TaxID=7918 RepID=UPI0035F520CB